MTWYAKKQQYTMHNGEKKKLINRTDPEMTQIIKLLHKNSKPVITIFHEFIWYSKGMLEHVE